MNIPPLHVVLPVKNSLHSVVLTIEALMESTIEQGFSLTVYDDYSDREIADELDRLAHLYGFRVVHLSDVTTHPSPNYRLVLQMAQTHALSQGAHLIIVESDVVVKRDTLSELYRYAGSLGSNPGLIAAVTVDDTDVINYPYLYASRIKTGVVATRKRLSFCCTLLTNTFLAAYDFSLLDPAKSWYDVFISHKATEIGFQNYLITSSRVVHRPHSSRPWKLLKYTHPVKYYWRKYIRGLDKI